MLCDDAITTAEQARGSLRKAKMVRHVCPHADLMHQAGR